MDAKTSTKQQLIQDLLIALTGGGIAILLSILVLHSRGHAVEDWQTLLAAVFGVIGLGLAHFLTASHQRQRDDRIKIDELETRNDIRREERKSIASALKAEIHSQQQDIITVLKKIDNHFGTAREEPVEIDETTMFLISLPRARVYGAFIDRLDRLPHDALWEIINFHSALEDYANGLKAGTLGNLDITNLEAAVIHASRGLTELDKIIDD